MRPGGGLWHDHRSPAALAARCFDEHARPHPHPAQDAQRRPMSVPQPRVREVRTGRVRTLARPGVRSAIDKQPVDGPIAVGALGLAGDEQGDLAIHGGPDKAVHLYAWAHYAAWRAELPGCAVLQRPGAFGENLSVDGLIEADVCIGDRWRVGSTLLEVSQGRQPCWKLNLRFGVADMAARVQDSLRAGWYCRVVEAGTLATGDALQLLSRPHPAWPIARLLALIKDRACAPRELAEVLELPLTASWRRLFGRRLEHGAVEDWTRRMQSAEHPVGDDATRDARR